MKQIKKNQEENVDNMCNKKKQQFSKEILLNPHKYFVACSLNIKHMFLFIKCEEIFSTFMNETSKDI